MPVIVKDCKTCTHEANNGPLDYTKGLKALAAIVGCNEKSIWRHRKHMNDAAETRDNDVAVNVSGGYELNAATGEGEFNNVTTNQPLETATDWRHIFERFKLDPDRFEIVGNTVRCSMWQQSRRTDDGDRDVIDLYSYRAQFQRKTADAIDLPALYAAARNITPARATNPGTRTTVVVYSDPQIGKVARRGGTPEYLQRAHEVRAKLNELLAERAPAQTVLLDGGDGFEGFNSGGNPMFTNDLSLAGQMDLYGTELFEFVNLMHSHAPVTVAGVPSNHTAWRNAKQNLGNPQDDLGLFMHHQVAKITSAAGMNVTWHEPEPYDESVAVTVPGATIGLVHGNQFGPGQAITWWEKQTFGAGAVTRADILVSGHYHSFGAGVAGRNPITGKQRTWLGAPTLDGGSDWFRQTAGRDSDPGLLVFDVTEDGFDLGSLTIL